MTAPCIEPGCESPKELPKHRCRECLENQLPMTVQVERAKERYYRAVQLNDGVPLKRVPADEWPEGRRWCAGCQSFRRIGLDVAPSASRCRPCASAASHASRTKATYGITSEDYAAVLEHQGGVCAMCLQRPVSKRLAVDHDHRTGEVRGLLCSRCNHDLLGSLHDSPALAWRAVLYLLKPPAPRVLQGDPVALGDCESCAMLPATQVVVVGDPSGDQAPEPFATCKGCAP